VGKSKIIDDLVKAGKIDVSEIKGKWEAFVSTLVQSPVEGCAKALVIAGSDPRGSIYGIYDVSEQIGVSPWYFFADVPSKQHKDIYVLPGTKVQPSPSIKYRGIFLNDEQPGLTNWVAKNWGEAWNGAANYNHEFYALVAELLLRLRANYLWPAIWGTIIYVDDPLNQPLLDAYEIVLGSSHTEPLMRAQNEFGTFYKGPWAYNLNNGTIDSYFRYGAERAKPYARNSLWTMAMRGTGDTEINNGLGLPALLKMLEELVHNQRAIIADVLDTDIDTVPQMWCLYKEVQSYQEKGLEVPESITLLWSDDNWGNIRRMPLANETERSGGAGVYYHFDYVGDPRDYKWINTIQLEKTAEQLYMAYARQADRIWIVNVGDLKPLELPISHFMDLAYDADRWGVDSTSDWLTAWAGREFGDDKAEKIADLMTRYGMYAGRRKYELIQPDTYSVINYNEGDAILAQWASLKKDADAIYQTLDAAHKPAFFEMILHPVTGGEIVNKIYITAAKNALYAGQKRNAANDLVELAQSLLEDDAKLTAEWDALLDGKWEHLMDQTHIGYDSYWQQPMRNTLPPMQYVQESVASIAGHVGVGVEGSNGTVPGDDQWHGNSGNDLTTPPMDPYGPTTRFFEVFARGTQTCKWSASPEKSFIKLSQTTGTIGPDGEDTRVQISIDWASVPDGTTATFYINVTSPCRGSDKFAYREPRVLVPVVKRAVPADFKGFVESDGVVSIEGPHYSKIVAGSSGGNITYHTFENYGRTLGGVGLYPPATEKLSVGQGPALEYNLYFFSNATANVTLFLSPSHNYLGDGNPLEYAVALFRAGSEPSSSSIKSVRPVGPTEGTQMPDGWKGAVADAVWGVSGKNTESSFQLGGPGAYTLRIWALLPSIVVQKVVVNTGGLRKSYLGPPESFLVGRDAMGDYDQQSFMSAPGTLGSVKLEASLGMKEEDSSAVRVRSGVWMATLGVVAVLMM